ncbi:ATP synthase subunit b [Burkholderiales bacterium]|jgi:F-type H+-transporting ATPase subunit b|nr:ATP synthase subunit b [Burkholderiales bacterium]
MQMDWTTFVLEVINFLVLAWLLQHFFYRPVLAVLDARQAKVQAIKTEAETIRRDAEALRTQYETRLADWNAERERERETLQQELLQERARRLDELRHELADEEAKSRARADAAAAAREAALRRRSIADAYGAAAAMLQRLASPALTARIVQLFCEDLDALGEVDRTSLRQAAAALMEQETVDISSACPLGEAERSALIEALARATGRRPDVRFREAAELIGGLRAAVGQCRLDASLADELAFFQQQGKHA